MEQRDIRRAQLRVHGASSRKRSPHRNEADQPRRRPRTMHQGTGTMHKPREECSPQSTRQLVRAGMPNQRCLRSWPNGRGRISHQKASLLQRQARIPQRASASARCSGRRCGPGLRRHGEGISYDRIVVAPRMACRSLGCMRQTGLGYYHL